MFCMAWATARMHVSEGPPLPVGTITLMGLLG